MRSGHRSHSGAIALGLAAVFLASQTALGFCLGACCEGTHADGGGCRHHVTYESGEAQVSHDAHHAAHGPAGAPRHAEHQQPDPHAGHDMTAHAGHASPDARAPGHAAVPSPADATPEASECCCANRLATPLFAGALVLPAVPALETALGVEALTRTPTHFPDAVFSPPLSPPPQG